MALNKINNFYNELIYIDSNIFLYALNKRHEFSNDCAKFLLKIDGGDMLGFTSVNCLNEVFHKMIYYEIEEKFRIQKKDVMSLIKRNPDIIYEMEVSYSALNDILTSRIVIVPLTIEIMKKSLDFSKNYRLLLSDAINAATCEIFKIMDIATNDRDFERVDFLKVWKP